MICTKFREVRKGALLGFADIELASGLTIVDCTLMEKDGSRWCSPPAKAHLDQDRRQVIKDGKPQYAAVITFKSKDTRDKWSAQAVEAIEAVAVIV